MKYKEVEKMHQDGYRIIDIRDPEELKTLNKLEFAENISQENLLQHYNKEFSNKDEKIAIVCKSGRRSQQVCDILKNHGFENVKNIDDGMLGIKTED